MSSIFAIRCYAVPMGAETVPFGDWLREEIDRRGWSVSDFAARINVRPSTVSRWTNNQRLPDPPFCEAIADALQLAPDDVLARAGHRTSPGSDLLSQVPIEVRWYFMNYRRLPLERQKLLLRQLRAYYEDLGLEDPTKGLLTEE